MAEAIGWFSSAVLVLTIAKQIYRQWQAETSEGVSKWLFVGQVTASAGFTVDSWLVKNWVFVITDSGGELKRDHAKGANSGERRQPI